MSRVYCVTSRSGHVGVATTDSQLACPHEECLTCGRCRMAVPHAYRIASPPPLSPALFFR